eukprot:jgi/Mesen1/10168/ME000076S09677
MSKMVEKVTEALHKLPGFHEKLPLIAIFGVTGSQGSSVAKALVKSGKYCVRGVTRDPLSAKAKSLSQEVGGKIEFVKADQGNYEELKAAFQGAYGVYAMTNFFAIGPRDKEFGARTAQAAKEAGVQHFIWSTLPNCQKKSGGKYHVAHFTGKAKVDPVVRSLGFKHHTFIVCGFYFQNFVSFGLCHTEEDGTVSFDVHMEGHHLLQAFDVHDVGPAVLAAFEHPQAWQEEEYMNLCGFHDSVQKYVELFSSITGRKAKLNTIPEIKHDKYGAEWTEMFKWFNEYTCFYDYDITNGRKANPGLKNWAEWLRASGWKGP